jgi:hypothetical protein
MKLLLAGTLIAGIVLWSGCGSPDNGGTDAGNNNPNMDTGTSAGVAASANPYPNFHGQDSHGEKNFAVLINNYAQAKTTPNPWAGFWWPYTENGIASGKFDGGKSPAGKYDAARGNTTHAQEWEINNHGSKVPKVQGWWGHCNGWCAASGLFPEPHANVKVNGVEFTIADQKALLSEASMETSADFYGARVDYSNDFNSPKWFDTVPDQYFLVLTNYIGKLNQTVLIDRYKIEYPKPSDYLGADPAHPDVYRMEITSTIWWAEDGVPPDVQTPDFHFQAEGEDYVFTPRTLKMEIWLDGPVVFGDDGKIKSSGNLIVTRQGDSFYGGTWMMGEGFSSEFWPDYMWVPYSVLPPTDYANNQIDIQWIRDHILSGGTDDPSVHPSPVASAPSPHASPTDTPTPTPTPTPTHSSTPQPSPQPTHHRIRI